MIRKVHLHSKVAAQTPIPTPFDPYTLAANVQAHWLNTVRHGPEYYALTAVIQPEWRRGSWA